MITERIKKGVSPGVLRSFRWVKPGIAEAQVVQEGVVDGDALPTMPALPIAMDLEAYREEWRDGVGQRTWTYRAGQAIPKSETDPNEEGPDEVWSCDVTLQERPLTSHPNIDVIMATYGGVLKSGNLEFPPRQADGSVNPLYMVETYLAPTVMVSYEKAKAAASVSVSSIKDLGFIDEPPDSGFNFLTSLSGQWLLTDHVVRKVGKDTSERQTWRWGGFGGWVPQVYRKGYWGG